MNTILSQLDVNGVIFSINWYYVVPQWHLYADNAFLQGSITKI